MRGLRQHNVGVAGKLPLHDAGRQCDIYRMHDAQRAIAFLILVRCRRVVGRLGMDMPSHVAVSAHRHRLPMRSRQPQHRARQQCRNQGEAHGQLTQ